MKQYFIDKFVMFKEFIKKEKWFLVFLSIMATSLIAAMFTEYALVAVFAVMIVGAILFKFEKGLSIFLFCYAFEAVFYIIRNYSKVFLFTIFYSILFLIYFIKYFIQVIRKQKKLNIKTLIPLVLLIVYILLPINPIKFDDAIKYVIATGTIYLLIESKDDIKFNNVLIIAMMSLLLTVLLSFVAKFSDRMVYIMGESYSYGIDKTQGMFTNPNYLVEYSILIIAWLLYKFIFDDLIWGLSLLVLLPYTYRTLSRDYMISVIILFTILLIFLLIKKKKFYIFRYLFTLFFMAVVALTQLNVTKAYAIRVQTIYNEVCVLMGIDKQISIPLEISTEKSKTKNTEKNNNSSNNNGSSETPKTENTEKNNNTDTDSTEIQIEDKNVLWKDGTPSDPGRALLWKRYYKDFISSPKNILFGVGISPEYLGVPPHNTYINLVWQFGVIGTIIAGFIFLLIFKEMLKGKNLLSILICLLVCFINMCEGNLFNYVAIMMILVLIGTSQNNKELKNNVNNKQLGGGKMKKISIIIPVYKVEEFLEDCVESVINQTYENLEIILVDDGSPDNCPKICDNLAKKDKRVKVIHKQNGGLSSARNAGLDIMTGDYVLFVDSDDSIHSQTCEILLNSLENNDADISMASYRNVFKLKGLKEKKYVVSKINAQIYENNDVFELIFNKEIPMVMVAWMKLYKKEFFDDLRFENGKLHEDEFIIHKTFSLCKKLTFANIPLYNYLQRQNSIIKSSFSAKRLHILEALEDRIEFVKTNKPEYEKDAILQYMKICVLCYYRAKWANFDTSILKEIKIKIDNYYEKGYKNLIVKMFYKCPKIMEKIIYLKVK